MGTRPLALYVASSMLRHGYLRVARPLGVELRFHWSVPLGALLFGALRFEPWLWLAFALVIAAHELGHALMGRWCGLQLSGLDVNGVGGDCRWRGHTGELELAAAAWGGILGQALLLLPALAVLTLMSGEEARLQQLLSHGFVEGNLWLIALNLLPLRQFDGARAWGLFPVLRARGWTLWDVLVAPLAGWARRRRAARGLTKEVHPAPPPPPVLEREPHRGAEPPAGEMDDDELPRPSAEAQRELAALLERIGKAAGKAKRRE